jgi:hypothetical protein
MKRGALRQNLLGGTALLGLTSPIFFSNYRAMIFDTIPRDDYALYLLALVGRAGALPPAPAAYRVLSVLPAAPLFRWVPLYVFTNATIDDVDYARATQAMALLSYLAMVATSILLYHLTTKHLACSAAAALVGMLLSYFAFGFTATYGVDPMCIATITLLICLLDRPIAFSLLIFLAIFVNEKVGIIFTCVLAARGISAPRFRAGRIQLASALASVATYFAVRHFFPVAGHENETAPSTYLTSALSTLHENLSLKGAFVGALPCALVLLAWLAARRAYRVDWVHLKPADVVVFPFMLGLALCINAHFTIGRDVMHGFPFLLPLLSKALDDAGLGRSTEVSAFRGAA